MSRGAVAGLCAIAGSVLSCAAHGPSSESESSISSALGADVCVTVDENSNATVSCPPGQVISQVVFASYGTPGGTCTAFTTSSCNAADSQSVVSAACLGQASCTVNASNTTFGTDPCFGTGKSLSIDVACTGPSDAAVPAAGQDVCASATENSNATLTCPQGQVISSIVFASFGTPTGSCGSFSAGSCNATNSVSVLEAACVGQSSCAVDASNTTFGMDPCFGTGKSLDVEAVCSGPATSGGDAGAADSGPPSTSESGTPPGMVPPLGTGMVTCGAANPGAGTTPSGTDPLAVDTIGTPGEDGSRMYPLGTPIQLSFGTQINGPDTVSWSLQDAWQNVLTSGQFAVASGSTTTAITCTSTVAGYIAIVASLSDGTGLPVRGTRRQGIATFGVLPNLSQVLPDVSYPHLDDHRFGMQGGNYINPNDPFNPICKDLGVTWTNMSFSQSDMEPNGPNTFSPSSYNPQSASSDSTYASDGLLPYITLNGLPGWDNSSGSVSASYPPSQPSEYQTFMSLVGQYRSSQMSTYPTLANNYYQVTWEPDPGTGDAWQGTDADFINFYKLTYEGLHSTDSHALVLGLTASSVSADTSMIDPLLSEGLGQYLDGFSYHGYYDAGCNWDHPPEDTSWGTEVPAQMRTLRHLLATSLKPHAKLIQTELGIMYEVSAADYSADYPSLPQLAEHGAVVARANLIELGEGADVTYFFYSSDAPPGGGIGYGLNFDLNYDPNNVATLWGTADISPKPAGMMAAALTRLVDGTVTLGYLNGLPSGVYGYAFQRYGNGPVITALWTHSSGWNASASYTLQVGGSGQVVVVDSMGNPSAAPVNGGSVSLTLGEYPLYVISSDAGTIKNQVTVPEGYDPQL